MEIEEKGTQPSTPKISRGLLAAAAAGIAVLGLNYK